MIEETEIFDLANNATKFVKEILDIKGNDKKQDEDHSQIGSSGYSAKIGSSGDSAQIGSSGDSAQIGSSGDYAKIGSSGYYAQIGSSGDSAQIGSSGYSAKIGSSGDSAKIGSSGYYAQIGSSGDSAKIGSSGYYAKIGSSGYSAKIGSSGDYAQIGSSGYSAQIGSSGYSAKIGSSGYSAKIGSSGDSAKIGSSGYSAQIGSSGDGSEIDSTGIKAVISANGFHSIVKGKIGSWITLAEYRKNKNNIWEIFFVKTEEIDGVKIKEDVYYTLNNKEFKEVEIIDGIKNIILKRKNNILKIKTFNDEIGYIFTKNGISAHGETVKKAYRDWLFKQSDRDVSKYENLKMADMHDINYWYECYRAITGACSFGTEQFMEQFKDKIKPQMSLEYLIEITEGQYGHNTFVEFFKNPELLKVGE